MKNKKAVFLFLLLVFPVLIYLFLQGFGHNQFDIPVYYQDGISGTLAGCPPVSDPSPYRIDQDEVNQLLGREGNQEEVIVYDLGHEDSNALRNNLYTFLEKFKSTDRIHLFSLRRSADTMTNSSKYPAWQRFNVPDSNLLRLGRCILRLDLDRSFRADSGLVLVDQDQQIRGYYDPLSLKEIDRLNTELYILLSQ